MAGAELVSDVGVQVKVAAVGIERVVDRYQPRVLEDRVGQAVNPTQSS
jgi:hypothetical protein